VSESWDVHDAQILKSFEAWSHFLQCYEEAEELFMIVEHLLDDGPMRESILNGLRRNKNAISWACSNESFHNVSTDNIYEMTQGGSHGSHLYL